jgi:RNA recognition motif-containing protein
VIPVDRETGRPRGFAFVEFLDRAIAEQAVERFNQQPFMGRSLSVSEARPREERPAGGGFRPSGGGGFGGPPRPGGPGGGFGGGGGGFSGPRPGSNFNGPGAGGGFRSGPPGMSGPPGKNFGPPKKKSGPNDKRWDAKERGPKGPIKERYTGRLGGLHDDPNDEPVEKLGDFDDVASSRAPDDDDNS